MSSPDLLFIETEDGNKRRARIISNAMLKIRYAIFIRLLHHFHRFPSMIHRVLSHFKRTSLFKPCLPIYNCLLKHKQNEKMKATSTILAVVLTFTMNVLFASNDGAVVNYETNSFHTSLAPETPAEATFEDVNDETAFILSPVSPIKADFSDAISETTIDITTLAPVTPIEAFFATDDETTNVSVLGPVTPSVADFSDGI